MCYVSMGLAMGVDGLRPLHKLVLLSVANRADTETHELWPSYEAFRADTGMDRKSVWQALKALKEAGLIEDTGRRKGITGQVQVLRLRVDRLRGEAGKEFQKRNDSENGTVPFFPSKSSENGTGNSSENGTGNQSLEPVKEPVKETALERPPVSSVSKKSALPCPVSEIIAEYHDAMPDNPRVKVISDKRRRSIAARWKQAATMKCRPFGYDTQEAGIEAWREFFAVCAASDFLTGKAKPTEGRPPFYADIDFLMSETKFAAILENKYHREAS